MKTGEDLLVLTIQIYDDLGCKSLGVFCKHRMLHETAFTVQEPALMPNLTYPEGLEV